MLDDEEYGSDSSDEDYVPEEHADGGSEEESGEEEDLEGLINDASEETAEVKGKKRAGKKTKKKEPLVRKRQGGIKLDGDEELAAVAAEEAAETEQKRKEMEAALEEEKKAKKEEEQKKKADSLWASFLSDVPSRPVPKPKPASAGLGSLSSVLKPKPENKPTAVSTSNTTETAPSIESKCAPGKPEKITITKEYDFAGELIKVTKEVDADSKEAKAEQKLKEKQQEEEKAKTTSGPSLPGLKRPAGGLGSVLGKIGKKPKMGTLEKSKLDWDSFKAKEGISEELQIHNRGKEGYIERQAFLNRTDQRQFENERQIRLSSKR